MALEYTIPHILEKTAVASPDKTALQIRSGDGYARFTYRELVDCAHSLASFFIAEGMQKGERIAIYSKSRPEWGLAYLGIVFAGGTAVPIDAELGEEEVKNILTHSGARAIVTSEENLRKSESALHGLNLRLINFDSKEFSEILKSNSPDKKEGLFLAQISEADIASIVYTSGTTGIPKGVMLSHKNICFDALSIIDAKLITLHDHVLGVLPLHHTYPFMTTFLTPIFAGATVTYLTQLKGPEIVKTMQECGITILVGVPELFNMLLRGVYSKMEAIPKFLLKGLLRVAWLVRKKTGLNAGKIVFRKVHNNLGPKLRYFASGGAKLDPDVAQGLFSLGFTILEGYGLTETSPVATLNPEKRPKLGSVGLPIAGVEIKILNPDKTGIGEIAIKGPIVMQGYYRNLEETKKIIHDGWLMTGDLGYKDSDGFVYITGRSKEVIVLSSGKNIYPEEVEKHYLNSRLIKEICVLGIENKKGVTEALHAVVVPNQDYVKEQKIVNVHEAVKWELNSLSAALPSYQRVLGYTVTKESIPRTPLGKIRRFMVKELTKGGKKEEAKKLTPEDDALLREPSIQKLLSHLKNISKKEHVNLDDNLELDLGIDSLQRVELVVAMEEMLDTRLPESFGQEMASVRDLVKKLLNLKVEPVEKAKINRWPKIFETEPNEDDKDRVGLKHGVLTRFIVSALLFSLKGVCKLLFRLEVRGIENLPLPPFILTPNHISYLDGFIIAAAAPLKTFASLYFVGLQKFFDNIITRRFARLAHIIPINPEAHVSKAMQLSGFALKNGKALCLFPEGGRSIDGRLLEFKKGIGILSKELNVPLVPTIIQGAFEAMPRGTWLIRPVKITVTFGKPIQPQSLDFSKRPEHMDDYEWITMLLRQEMERQML